MIIKIYYILSILLMACLILIGFIIIKLEIIEDKINKLPQVTEKENNESI